MSNFNLLLGVVYAYMLTPFMLRTAPDTYYVPSKIAFYGYMLVAILTHDILFYHGHRYTYLIEIKYLQKVWYNWYSLSKQIVPDCCTINICTSGFTSSTMSGLHLSQLVHYMPIPSNTY